MFLVPVVLADFGNGSCSKLGHCLVLTISKRLVFVLIFVWR